MKMTKSANIAVLSLVSSASLIKNLFLLPTLITALVTASSVQAQYTEVDISSQVNADLQLYGNGMNYPFGGTQLNVAGIPFGLAELNNNPNTTGVVQPGPTSGGGSSSLGPFDYTFSLPLGTHATVLYCLMNTAWGVAGVNEGSVVVTGTLGETATLTLTEGFNIRDHNNDGYCNTLSDPTVVTTGFQNGAVTTSTNAPVRLDCQQLALPGAFFGDTIESVTFEGNAEGEPNGSAFVAAMTLSNVPEPTSLSLLAFGILGIIFLRRRSS